MVNEKNILFCMLTSLSVVHKDRQPESHKTSLYMCVFHMLLKTHRITQACFVSSAYNCELQTY